MTKPRETICLACGAANEDQAERCGACGAELDSQSQRAGARPVDGDPALSHIDPENRVELSRYERADEVTLACGLLRANQIPCEVSSMMIPGLPSNLILWVNAEDAKKAWALLADVDREASKGNSNAA